MCRSRPRYCGVSPETSGRVAGWVVFATGLVAGGVAGLSGFGCCAALVEAFFGPDAAADGAMFVFGASVARGAVAFARGAGVTAVEVFVPAAGTFAGDEPGLKALG